MPAKWTDLPKDVREAIANELRKLFGDLHDLLCKYILKVYNSNKHSSKNEFYLLQKYLMEQRKFAQLV